MLGYIEGIFFSPWISLYVCIGTEALRVFLFLILIFFKAILVYSKIKRRKQRFSIYSLCRCQTYAASPITNIPDQSGTFVTTGEPTLTCHYHSESIVHMRVHSGCCTIPESGQMYPSLWSPTQGFHWLKNPPCSTCSFLPLNSFQPLIFLLSP